MKLKLEMTNIQTPIIVDFKNYRQNEFNIILMTN